MQPTPPPHKKPVLYSFLQIPWLISPRIRGLAPAVPSRGYMAAPMEPEHKYKPFIITFQVLIITIIMHFYRAISYLRDVQNNNDLSDCSCRYWTRQQMQQFIQKRPTELQTLDGNFMDYFGSRFVTRSELCSWFPKMLSYLLRLLKLSTSTICKFI